MNWYHWLVLAASGYLLVVSLIHVQKLVRAGMPKDLAPPKSTPEKAMMYAFTGAMSPRKKESAYLHLPTYTAGMIYHLGTFLSVFLLVFLITGFVFPAVVSLILSVFLILSCLCGVGILIKRMVSKNLKGFSNPDDYVSNLLVDFFQACTALLLLNLIPAPVYFVGTALLMLYLPVGKLRHYLYFFAARIHLAFFYGRRGVWPPH